MPRSTVDYAVDENVNEAKPGMTQRELDYAVLSRVKHETREVQPQGTDHKNDRPPWDADAWDPADEDKTERTEHQEKTQEAKDDERIRDRLAGWNLPPELEAAIAAEVKEILETMRTAAATAEAAGENSDATRLLNAWEQGTPEEPLLDYISANRGLGRTNGLALASHSAKFQTNYELGYPGDGLKQIEAAIGEWSREQPADPQAREIHEMRVGYAQNALTQDVTAAVNLAVEGRGLLATPDDRTGTIHPNNSEEILDSVNYMVAKGGKAEEFLNTRYDRIEATGNRILQGMADGTATMELVQEHLKERELLQFMTNGKSETDQDAALYCEDRWHRTNSTEFVKETVNARLGYDEENHPPEAVYEAMKNWLRDQAIGFKLDFDVARAEEARPERLKETAAYRSPGIQAATEFTLRTFGDAKTEEPIIDLGRLEGVAGFTNEELDQCQADLEDLAKELRASSLDPEDYRYGTPAGETNATEAIVKIENFQAKYEEKTPGGDELHMDQISLLLHHLKHTYEVLEKAEQKVLDFYDPSLEPPLSIEQTAKHIAATELLRYFTQAPNQAS